MTLTRRLTWYPSLTRLHSILPINPASTYIRPSPFTLSIVLIYQDQITFGMPYTIRWQSSFSSSDLTLFQGPYADNSYSQVNLKSKFVPKIRMATRIGRSLSY